MVRHQRDRRSSFSNFFASGFSQANLLATSLFPNIAFSSSSLTSLSSSMNSISSSTFYVSCAEEIHQLEKRQQNQEYFNRDSKDGGDEEVTDEMESATEPVPSIERVGADGMKGHMPMKDGTCVSSISNENEVETKTYRGLYETSSTNNSMLINELKCKLRDNKSQIRANRGKLKEYEWNLELLKGNWENFVDWRSTLSDEKEIFHKDRVKPDLQAINTFAINNYAGKPHSLDNIPSYRLKPKLQSVTEEEGSFSKLPPPSLVLSLRNNLSRDVEGMQRLRKFGFPREISKPYERNIKERTSFKSYTYNKLHNYRNKLTKKQSFDLECRLSDKASTCDDDTISELSFTTSCTTEEYDSGKRLFTVDIVVCNRGSCEKKKIHV